MSVRHPGRWRRDHLPLALRLRIPKAVVPRTVVRRLQRTPKLPGYGPVVGHSSAPGVIDRVIHVPDAASIAAMRSVRAVTGRTVGESTGTSAWGALCLAAEMRASDQRGSTVRESRAGAALEYSVEQVD